jgi:diguanylate cyclase (GGDEF)-like protein/PAS domain S-box-containing protein
LAVTLEEFLAEAADAAGARFSELEIRRNLHAFERHRRELASRGVDPAFGVDTADPLRLADDEWARVVRQTELAGLGAFALIARDDTLVWSPQLARMLGYEPATTEASVAAYLDRVHRGDRDLVRDSISQALTEQRQVRLEHRVVLPSGEVRYLRCVLEVHLDVDDEAVGVIGTAQDATEFIADKRALERANRRLETVLTVVGECLADHDPQTGLFNRRRFLAEVDRELPRGSGAVLVVGLDGVGDISRRQGPDAGDNVLLAVASTVQRALPPEAVLARIGGTDFAVLVGRTSARSARAVARGLVDVLGDASYLAAKRLPVVARIGLAPYREGSAVTGEDLLIEADQSLYEAREQGVPLVEASPPDRADTARWQARCQARVSQAMQRGRFDLEAQPILEVGRGVVTRHELLLRLNEGGDLLRPASFLPTAERTGDIVRLDRYVIGQAVELLAADRGGLHVQVNVSGRSVCEEDLPGTVRQLLDRYGVHPGRLTFEITETALISNMTAARRFVDRLHELGCEVALDDFGSGYMSLTHLKYLPFDLVKIDGEFVERMTQNERDRVMVRAVAHMCAALGIRTVAEYVANDEVLDLIAEYGIDFAQGYAVGRPVPVAEVFGTRRVLTA